MAQTQEQLWKETTTDDLSIEREALRGGDVPTDMDPKMHHDLQVILSRLVGKARQLIENETTNIAESWMHIRSKFDRGKVVNRSQSGSWEHRCMGAGLQQNIGKKWGPACWMDMTDSPPNDVFVDAAECSAKKVRMEHK